MHDFRPANEGATPAAWDYAVRGDSGDDSGPTPMALSPAEPLTTIKGDGAWTDHHDLPDEAWNI
jgi:hypothetical protein